MMGEEGEEGDASTPQSAGFLEPPAKRGGGLFSSSELGVASLRRRK